MTRPGDTTPETRKYFQEHVYKREPNDDPPKWWTPVPGSEAVDAGASDGTRTEPGR